MRMYVQLLLCPPSRYRPQISPGATVWVDRRAFASGALAQQRRTAAALAAMSQEDRKRFLQCEESGCACARTHALRLHRQIR
jgi:hypothetical protein